MRAPATPVPAALASQPFPAYARTMGAPQQRGELASLRERLDTPAKLIGAAICVTVADLIYTRATGEVFTVASHRPVWITAPLAVLGVGLACWRVFGAL